MSASLVGSEMCIRDSLSGKRMAKLKMRLNSLITRDLHQGLRSTRQAYYVCLLYTSDAADDM
eukprot:10876768-Alexandrium_andersonii.AAC.1